MSSLNKATLAGKLVEISSINAKDRMGYIDSVLDILKKSFNDSDDVMITNFGRFIVQHKKSRTGRNPKTGEDIKLAPRKVVKFRPADSLRELLNK